MHSIKSPTVKSVTTVRESILGSSSSGALRDLVGPRPESKEEKEKEDFEVCTLAPVVPRFLMPFISKSKGGAKEWLIPIPFAANLASNGSGFVSAAVLMSSCAAASAFTSLATIFDEFFIESAKIHYQPVTRYQVLPSTSSSEFNGTPLGCASLYMDLTPYTNINQMPANPTFQFHHTSDPFIYTWRNNVKRESAVSEEPDSTHNSLSWVRTNATPAQYYGGAVSLIGSASSAVHASTTLGIVAVRYKCWFRSKS